MYTLSKRSSEEINGWYYCTENSINM